MILSREEKLFFLSLINDNKELLFGAFDVVHITAESKKLMWDSIRSSLLSRGVKCPQDAAHLRDVSWSNIKRAALTKVDANQKTGAGGGKLLTEIDEIVLKILGKNSPTVRGIIGVPERSSKPAKSDDEFEDEEQQPPQKRNASALEEVCVTQTPPSSVKRRSSSVQQQSFASNSMKKEPSVKDCYYAALLHKTKLEIFELEQRCGLPCKYSIENGLCAFYNS